MFEKALRKPVFWGGLFVFAAVFIIYFRTCANAVSYWDCGEFSACAYTLGVPHPPGSPLFILVGRLFTMIPYGEIGARATWYSALAGVFTALLTYLITVRFLRMFRGKEENLSDQLIVVFGGMISAFVVAFSPSQWFNSVESEVYGISLFLTALVIWLVMKWTDDSETGEYDHYLLLATYLNGFAVTIHLLNLLTIPTIFLIVWYKRRELAYYLLAGWAISYIIIDLPLDIGVPFWLKLLSVPVALGFFIYFKRQNKHETALVPMIHILTFLGFTLYALIYIRANLNPMINENDPSTLASLKAYLSREQYGTDNMVAAMFNRKAPFWEYQIKKMYLRYFDWNFIGIARDIYPGEKEFATNGVWRYWGLPFFLGLFGAFYHFARDRRRAFANLVLFVMTGLAIVMYLNQDDPQPRERDYAYTGSYFAFALWVGIGAVGIIDWIKELLKKQSLHPALAGGLGLAMLLAVPGRMLAVNFHENDRMNNYVAYDYSRNMLESCDQNAMLFTNGDNDTFPLWYIQETQGIRKDVTVVNLSLINTGWYIKHMRDKFHVPISFDDAFIERYIDAPTEEAMMTRYWPPNRRQMTIRSPQGPMTWTVPAAFFIPTEENPKDRSPNFLRVQDMMILDIMRSNVNKDGTWKRPVYFAATVSNSSMAGLSNYGVMEGLAFQVRPQPRTNAIDPEKMYDRMVLRFKDHYRHLDDPTVFYDDNQQRLLQNYRSCFLQLAFYYYQQIQTPEARAASSNIPKEQWETRFSSITSREKVLFLLDYMAKIMPESVLAFDASEIVLQVGKMYYELGRPAEFETRLKKLSDAKDPSNEDLLMLAGSYEQYLNRQDDAKALYDRALGATPAGDALYHAGEILYRSGLDSAAIRMLVRAGKSNTLSKEMLVRTGTYLIQMNAFKEAEEVLAPSVAATPDDGTLLGSMIAIYERTNQHAKIAEMLTRWVARHPEDKGAQQRLDEAKKLAGITKSGSGARKK